MVLVRVRYLVERPQKGHTLYYWLPTKKLQDAGFSSRRLSNERTEAMAQAERLNAELDLWYRDGPQPAASKVRPGSLQALHNLFEKDGSFTKLRERSQRDYAYAIRPALEWAGDMQAADISRKALRAWYRKLLEGRGPSNARNTMAVLRRLLSFGVDEGWLATNPALKMGLVTPASRARLWTLEERDRFVEQAMAEGRASVALAVMLGWCLGQRPADLRTLAWSAYDGQAVAIRQAKTDARVWIPAAPELRRLLDATPRRGVQIVVSEKTSRPYAESDLQHRFAAIRDAAGLPADLQFRDLRRTLATALGAAGCTDDQIRAVTGHRTRSVVAVYVRPDRTFAEGAMKRLESAKRDAKLKGTRKGQLKAL